MDIIIGGRKSGKSTEAVDWLKAGKLVDGQYDRVVVQPTATMATTFKNTCMAQGLTKDLDRRVFAKAGWDQRAHAATTQVMYEEAQTYLPADASVITITGDGKLKALTNYNVPTA